MHKVFHTVIEILSWGLILLAPLLLSLLIAFLLYTFLDNTLVFYLLIPGVLGGVLYAENVRARVGCATYLGRILATPDLWPTDKGKPGKKKQAS